jgi:succinate dehydrogenase / fumarate reductase flavoprotein subunit
MYHQFKELADVDITKEPMEVGPTCHYVMGGVEVDPDTEAARVPGLFAAGEVAGGMHGSNRLGGNSLSDLLVFGRRAGAGASAYVDAVGAGGSLPRVHDEDVTVAAASALAPFEGGPGNGGENPYTLHQELQQTMNDLVGIIRHESEMLEALARLEKLKERAAGVLVEGHRQFNPGWHLALDLRNMLLVSECVARAALERQESRGGHTRDDYPEASRDWRQVNIVCSLEPQVPDDGALGGIAVRRQALPVMPGELLGLFERDELSKYMTDPELERLPAAAVTGGAN